MTIKKLFIIVLLTLIFQTPFPASANNISLEVNGTMLEQRVVVENNTTLVPLRQIFEALEAEVTFNPGNGQILAHKDSIKTDLRLNSKIARVNGTEHTLTVPPKMIENVTYVPLRFVSTSLGAQVNYDKATQRISIRKQSGPVVAAPNIIDNRVDLPKEDIVYYSPYYQGLGQLTTPETGYIAGNESILISGVSKVPGVMLVVMEKGSDKATYKIPVVEGKFSANIALRFGKGDHSITIYIPDQSREGWYLGLAKIKAYNLATRDGRYLLPSDGVESDSHLVKELALTITKNSKTDFEKAKAIHNWISKNIAYDMEKYKVAKYNLGDGALRTIELRKGLCLDYSQLAVALSRSIGLEARIAVGKAKSKDEWFGHAWNEVKVGGRWIVMDTTWDSGYLLKDTFVAKAGNKYFDPNKDEFEKTHRLEEYRY